MFCGLIFLSVLVTILTIEILTKRQSVEEDSKNQTNTAANTTVLQVENTTTMSRATFNLTSASADSAEDQPSTTELLQIEGDTTSNPVTEDKANATELQVEDSTSAININTSSPEENDEESDYPVEAVNNYDIQSSLEDYEYEYSYPSSVLSSYS